MTHGCCMERVLYKNISQVFPQLLCNRNRMKNVLLKKENVVNKFIKGVAKNENCKSSELGNDARLPHGTSFIQEYFTWFSTKNFIYKG